MTSKMRKSIQAGFTLIEVMIVVAIIGILAAIALPSYRDHILRSRIAEATAGLETMRTEMERYYQDHRTYASGGGRTTPCAAGRSVEAFDLRCGTPAADQNTFVIEAAGKGMANGFTYTLNQRNERFTTAVPSGSGYNTCTTNSSGWMIKKGQSC